MGRTALKFKKDAENEVVESKKKRQKLEEKLIKQTNNEPKSKFSLNLLNELNSLFLVKHPPEILEFWEWAKTISSNPKGNF